MTEEESEVKMTEGFCVNCETRSTPMWRAGPAGPKSLCNACGLRWKKGALRLQDIGVVKVGPTVEVATKVAKVAAEKKMVPVSVSMAMPVREKRRVKPTAKVQDGRVYRQVPEPRESARIRGRPIPRYEVAPTKIMIDFERYECLFSGLMVVSKFKKHTNRSPLVA